MKLWQHTVAKVTFSVPMLVMLLIGLEARRCSTYCCEPLVLSTQCHRLLEGAIPSSLIGGVQ